MDTNRRDFLIQSGAAMGVVGLGYMLWDPQAPSRKDGLDPETPGDAGRPPAPARPPGKLLGAAIRKMRDENKFGVAVRIPDDAENRHMAGHTLDNHLNGGTPERDELFAETVFICLESAVIQKELLGADPSHSLYLFNPAGRVLASVPFNYAAECPGFVRVARTLVHGEDNARLRPRADSILAECDPIVAQALARLESPEDKSVVLERASTLAPLLVYEKLQAPAGPRRAALTELIGVYVASAAANAPGPRLPFGVVLEAGGRECGDCCDERPPRNYSIACGMARVRPNDRWFVRYLKS